MRTLALLAAALWIPATAFAQAPSPDGPASCEALLLAMEASGETLELAADDAPIRSFVFSPSPESNFAESGRYEERTTLRMSDGTVQTGITQMSCLETVMLVHGFTTDDGIGSDRYEPPMPWLHLPLVSGAQWTWEGLINITGPDGQSESSVDARGAWTVGDLIEFQPPFGEPFEVLPVEFVVRTPAGVPFRQVTWYALDETLTIVHRVRYGWGGEDVIEYPLVRRER